MRNFIKILNDWVISTEHFTMPDFSTGEIVGKIYVGIVLEVWKIEVNGEFLLGAIEPSIGPANPCGFVGFKKMSGNNAYISRNALVDEQWARKGIVSELFRFMSKVLKNSFLSDTHMTADGASLWKSLIANTTIFDVKIYYAPTNELLELSDIGKQTSDGIKIIAPDKDNHSEDFYDPATKSGQRFYYAIMASIAQPLAEGFGSPLGPPNNGLRLYQPIWRHFEDGDY